MTLLIKGIDRLSQLLIDADKDWNTKGITNIKQVAALMSKGDLLARSDNILVKIGAGGDGLVLTATGVGKLPTWAPAGGALKYYFPVFIYSSHAEAKPAVNQSIAKTIAIPNPDKKYAYADAPGDNIKLLTPAPTTTKTHVVVPVDKSIPKTPAVRSDIAILVDGAVSEKAFDAGTHTAADSFTIMTDAARAHWVADALIGKTILNTTDGSSGVITDNDEHTATVVALIGGFDQTWQAGDAYIVQTDETAAARSAGVNDMNLCPMSGDPLGLGDKYYLGFRLPFRRVYITTSTAGAGNWANQAFYWSSVGPAWVAVADEDDQTAQFMVTTTRRIDWTMPGDWVQSVIMGMNLYWIKIETVAFVSQVTKPLGATAWACPVA